MPSIRSFLVLVAAVAAVPALAQQPPQGPPPVDVAQPLVETVTDHEIYTGRFEATERVELRARVSGYLEEIRFEDGSIVEEGQELFVIDQRPFRTAVEQAEAQVASAEAAARLARIELERASTLAERNVGSGQEVDRTEATLQQRLADVAAAQARLAEAELELEFTTIDAPFHGRISANEVDRGNLITGGAQGATTLATIVSVSPIYFVFTASEADYLRYSRLEFARPVDNGEGNIPVQIKLMDEEGFPHEGRLNFVTNELDPNSGTITGRAILEDPPELIVPGLFGRIRIASSRPYEALLVPDEAVLADQSRRIVLTVDAEGTVGQAAVMTGPIHNGLRIIRDGISADTCVVVAGVQRARPGQKVSPGLVRIEMGEAGTLDERGARPKDSDMEAGSSPAGSDGAGTRDGRGRAEDAASAGQGAAHAASPDGQSGAEAGQRADAGDTPPAAEVCPAPADNGRQASASGAPAE